MKHPRKRQFLILHGPAYGRDTKPSLMLSRSVLSRIIIIAFIALTIFALGYGIWAESATGIILSLISLGTGIHFLYLIAKAKKERDAEETI